MPATPSPLMRWMARAACWLFYRVDCAGSVPAEGAVLILPNHPNALLDPAVIWATAGRDVRFLAKSTLFEGLLRPIISGAGAIPVYRRLDQGADISKNTETFAAVDHALAQGDAICIFPEGVSHSTGRLVPLRTGAARMALAAAARGVSVALVPVGLNFERKTRFRSRVTVVYGQPFEIADSRGRNHGTRIPADPRGSGDETRISAHSPGSNDPLPPGDPERAAAVRALTERIAAHMRRLVVEADPGADAAIVDRVDRLYAAARGWAADPQERVARRRVIATGLERLRAADPQRYEEILLRVRRYDHRLRRFGLRDRHLDWRISTSEATRFAVRELAAGTVLMPLAGLGMALFFAPYHLTGIAARRFTNEKEVAATAKIVAGSLIYLGWLLAIAALVWILAGARTAMIVAALIPMVAVAALFAIERESAVIDAVRAWFLLRRARGETRERLKRTRSELAEVLDDVYAWIGGSGSEA